MRRGRRGCEEVLHPRLCQPLRAPLLPDCVLWTAEVERDAARRTDMLQRLWSAWRGSFAHPAVIEARRMLQAP